MSNLDYPKSQLRVNRVMLSLSKHIVNLNHTILRQAQDGYKGTFWTVHEQQNYTTISHKNIWRKPCV